MNRWDALTQQISEALKARQLGPIVFARLVWQSVTPAKQLVPKLAQLLQTLSQWMQQTPEKLHVIRSPDERDVTLIVEFHPSATAVMSHVQSSKAINPGQSMAVKTVDDAATLSLDLFLLGTQGAIYLDGTQADWPHEPLIIPDLPTTHPLYQQIERLWVNN